MHKVKRTQLGVDAILLNVLRHTAVPIAIYSRKDLIIRYANGAFMEAWKIDQTEQLQVSELLGFGFGTAVLQALRNSSGEFKTTVFHTVSSADSETFFESVIETLTADPAYIIQIMHDVTRLKSANEQLNVAVMDARRVSDSLHKELLAIGKDQAERANSGEHSGQQLMKMLDFLVSEGGLLGIGYWSLDLEDMSIDLSGDAKRILGFQETAEVGFDEVCQVIDGQHAAQLDKLRKKEFVSHEPYHFECCINPANGNRSKWLKCLGIVMARKRGRPEKIGGVIIVA